jgi:hypothetical protein
VNTIDSNVIVDMLEKHLTRLREDARYQNAVIYVYIEANMSWVTANDIKKVVEQPRFYPVIVRSYDTSPEQKPGVHTGQPEKEMYSRDLQRALGDGQLCYADRFISDDPNVKQELRSQMEVYRREVEVGPNGKLKSNFTGKSNGRKDDLCMVVQMLLYWSRLERESAEYVHAATANGWRL